MNKLLDEENQRIYFVGIGGIGVSAIARFMRAAGREVFGSDLSVSEITRALEKEGIKIFYEQTPENLERVGAQVVVYTKAAQHNPEVLSAQEKNLPTFTYFEALGEIFNDHHGIAVCGTHGKSTTTAMLGGVLEDGGLDPSVLVGSIVPRYESNLRLGSGNCFVAEACEYGRNFLSLKPQVIVLGNIELDHTDCYANLSEIEVTFEEFINHLSPQGILIYNGDSESCGRVVQRVTVKRKDLRVFTFGEGEKNHFRLKNFEVQDETAHFEVEEKGELLGAVILRVPGKFNAMNALATLAAARVLDISFPVIASSLASFVGIWRRFEIKGKYKNALVVSDYAHHPTAVRGTIRAAREFYPHQKITVVFQPHQHNRTKELYADFLEALQEADELILLKIYDVAGREEEEDQDVSSEKLAYDLVQTHPKLNNKIFYAPDRAAAKKMLEEKKFNAGILLIMGAGDVYKLADELLEAA